MSNQKGFIPILIAILIALVLGGYFVYTNSQTKTLVPITQPSPGPTDETANWKIYTHPNGFYQVSYPSTWTFIGKTGGGGPVFTPVPESETSTSSWLLIGWPWPPENPDETLEDRASQALSKGRTLLKREKIFIDGHEAIKQTIKDDNGYAIEVYVADVKDSDGVNGILPIFIYNREGVFPSKYQSTFNQILSTFRFDSLP